MAEHENDFDLARLDEQIEHPAHSLDAPARRLVEDLEQMYQTPAAESQANRAACRQGWKSDTRNQRLCPSKKVHDTRKEYP